MTARSRYEKLSTDREPFLRRARECARLTLPSLVPPEGVTESYDYPTPYQSMGAEGVNNLAAKLLLTLFPPGSPFFRFSVAGADPDVAAKMDADPQLKARIEAGLGKAERKLTSELEASAARPALFIAFRHLLIAGNILLHRRPSGEMLAFRLGQYVVRRDPAGNLVEIVVKECVDPTTLPEAFQALVQAPLGANQGMQQAKPVDVFTHVMLGPDGRWKSYQEIGGKQVPGTQATYPRGKLPWLALRWSRVEGEDYGRSYAEEYLGDLISLEGLMQAIVEGSAASAKVLFFNNPNGVTETDDITDAPNGGVVEGREDDVGVLQVHKHADFRVALETIERLEKRLARAFLMFSSVTRDAERVTAEEIRVLANELENVLGGTYSLLTHELQLALVEITMAQMIKQGRLPDLPPKLVRPTIITGLEALGRGHEIARLDAWINGIARVFGPEAAAKELSVGGYARITANGYGIDPAPVVKSPEQRAQEDQAEQMQALIEKLGPQVVQQLGAMMQQQQKVPTTNGKEPDQG